MILAIIFIWLAIALIYANQYQVTNDYVPCSLIKRYSYSPAFESDCVVTLSCNLEQEATFKWRKI